jgi:broad specificity phosphatase PhoE
MQLLLVRHGRHGVPAVPQEGNLTLQGLEQARLTGKALADRGVERLFCSPYVRAMQTGLVISRTTKLPVEIMVLLHNRVRPRERIPGREEISARYPDFVLPDDLPEGWSPGGEDWRGIYRRAALARKQFLSMEGEHDRVAAVTHAWPLDALTSVLVGARPKSKMRFWFDNCSTTLVSLNQGRGRIHYLNDVSHLKPASRPLFFG